MLDDILRNFKISQLGYVYKDIEKQAHILESIMGLPKFAYFENKGNIYKYRGKDSKIWTKIALSRILNTQIKLIQLIEGDCIFREFINSVKEGLHHFGIFVDDSQLIKTDFLDKGFEIVHEGTTVVYRVVYFDTLNPLGI